MGRPSKRKAQDPREEMQPELQEEQFVEEGEEILRSPSRDSQQPGKYTQAAPVPRALLSCAHWLDLLCLFFAQRLGCPGMAGSTSGVVDCGTP